MLAIQTLGLWKGNIDHTAAESLHCCLQIVSFLNCQSVAIATRGYLEPSPPQPPYRASGIAHPGRGMCAEETTESMDTLRYEGNMPETQAKAIAKAVGVALHQGVATHDDINDVKTLIGHLGTHVTLLETKLKIQQFWIYLIVGLTALTNPVALHIYQSMGWVK